MSERFQRIRFDRRIGASLAYAIGVAGVTLMLQPSTVARAETVATITPWNRLTLDLGYGLSFVRAHIRPSVYYRDSSSGAESSALIHLHYRTISHGVSLDSMMSLVPWFGIGLDLRFQRDFTAPTHDWFEKLGIEYNRRRAWSLGVVVESRPWQRDYGPRSGWFFRGGAHVIWADFAVSRRPGVEVSQNGRSTDLQGSIGGGYRLTLARAVSLHLMADLSQGLDSFEGRLRVGGGIQ
jgi:hypothetical protein